MSGHVSTPGKAGSLFSATVTDGLGHANTIDVMPGEPAIVWRPPCAAGITIAFNPPVGHDAFSPGEAQAQADPLAKIANAVDHMASQAASTWQAVDRVAEMLAHMVGQNRMIIETLRTHVETWRIRAQAYEEQVHELEAKLAAQTCVEDGHACPS